MGGALVVTVFGSSRPHEGDADYEEARILGRSLAKHGFFVCSGGFGGGGGEGGRGGQGGRGGKNGGGPGNFLKRRSQTLGVGRRGRGGRGGGVFLLKSGAAGGL